MAKDPAKWNCLSLLNYALGAVKIVGSAILVLIIPDCVESTAYIFPAISLVITTLKTEQHRAEC
jgi:hypothetical protein